MIDSKRAGDHRGEQGLGTRPPPAAVDCHSASPTVSGNFSAELSMISGRK